jgi:hypothetical protein
MAEERNIELPDVDLDAALAEAMSGSGGLSTKIPTLNELTESINIGTGTGTGPAEAYKSQDTFTGRVGKSFDEAQLNFFGGLKVYGDELDLDFLKDIANSGIETQKEDISKYKPSERSASFTKGIDEVSDLYNEEGLGSAIERGALLAKDMVATAIGSFGLTGSAVLAGAAAAPITGGASLLVAPFLVGGAQGTGAVYEEAKKLGASEKDSREYAIAGGAVIGALDRIGAASVLSGLVKNFGKNEVKKVLAKDVGEEAAETALGQALKIGQTTAKGAAKGGISEGITEGFQEQTQISFAGMAADEGLFPYKADENINRLLDAVALGIAGGASIRGVTENFAPKERYVPMKLAEEIKKENEKLLNSINDADTEISKRASDTDTFQEGFIGAARKLVAKSTSPLINLAERSDLGSKVKNAFDTQPDVKAETTAKFINKYNNILKENNLIRSVKLPFQSPVSKKDNKELSKALFNESTYTSPDVRIDKAAKQIRNLLGQIDEEGITLTSQSLNDAIVNNKQTLNEISEAVQKGAITEEQANGTYYSAFNSVKENFNETLKGLGEPTPENVQTALAEVQSKNPQYKILQNAELKKTKYTGLFQELQDQGIDINFEADYLPVSYKLSTKAQRKLAKEVLIKAGMKPSSIDRFIENLKDTDYQSQPMVKDLSWEYDSEGRKTVAKKESFEESRTLPKKARDALFDAGLVEDNASAVLTSHFLNVGNRIGNQKITDAVNKLFTESPESVTKGEFKRIKDLHKAINGKWQIQDESLRKISNFSRAAGYISTMALSAFTALSEPFIIFSSLSPKHALPLTVKTLGIGFRRALRSILPKISKTEMEKNFENILQGLDGSLAERFNEIEGFTTSKKVTNTFFKLTLLTEVTQLSRYMAYSAMRNNLLDDAIRAQADNSLSKPTVDGNKAASRLQKIYGIANPKTNKTLTEWIESGGKDNPTLINRALSKAVDDNIMAPNTVNKPLLMSNPNYAVIFQLKAFLTVFGNTVGFRIWRDITTPMYGGKAGGLPKNPEAAVKAALSLAMIMTVAAAAQAMKDEIRYGDEDSPFDDKEGGAMLLHLLMNTGIFGAATFLKDMIDASEYGSSPLSVLLGPIPSKIADLISGLSSSNPRTVARSITSTVPLLGNIPIANSLRGDIVDGLEDTLVDVGYERKRSTGGRISYRAEGGSIKEPVKYKDKDGNWNTYTNEEMLQWDTVIGADTTTEGSGSALYDAATEGKLASYLSGEAKDAYNFLKDYDYSDLDIMDTLQKGGTAMLTGIADSIKSGVDASTKAVAGQEYNPNAVLEPVLGAGAGSAMFSAPKGALRVFGGKNATSMKGGEAPEWKKAESMIEEGKSPENIHKETGLYLASDNKLRYEIPDNKAQLNTEKVDDMLSWIKRGKPARRTDVSNVLTHSDLYEEYPELRDIDLVLRPLREGEGAKGGHWDSYNNEIVAITDENGNIDKDYLLSTLIHELDHAAHSREGIDFNSGWSSLAANQVRRANKPLMDASGILYNSEQMMEAKDLPDLLSMISNSNSASLNSEPVQEAIKELLSKTIKSDKNRIGDFSKDNLVVNPERSYKSKNESETTYELKDGKGYITEFKYKDEDGNWNTYIGGEVNNPMGVETSYNGGTIRIGDMDLNSFDDLEKWNKDYYENVRLDLERALRNRPTDMLSSFLENKYYEADRIAGKFELMYHKNFGEVLARTSEDRANMTKAERSATFPENNMDVKRNDQLIGKNRTDFEESLTPEENKAWRKSMKTLQNQRVGMSKEKKGFKKGGAIYNLRKRSQTKKLAEGGQVSEEDPSFYSKLPVNIRTFLDTVTGSKETITEKDFTPEDLEWLRDEYEKKKALNTIKEDRLKSELMWLPKTGVQYSEPKDMDKYKQFITENPEGAINIGNLKDTTYERRDDLTKKVESYEKTKGKTAMSPSDYASDTYDHEGNWVKSIEQSFNDPSYRAGTTLSQFIVEQQEDGSVLIIDKYDWTKKPEKLSLLDYLGAVRAVKSPEQLGNLFIRMFKPETARNVRIKLPEVETGHQAPSE